MRVDSCLYAIGAELDISVFFSTAIRMKKSEDKKKNKKKNKIYMNQVKFASNCIHLFFSLSLQLYSSCDAMQC